MNTSASLRAGAAAVDITPAPGTPLSGSVARCMRAQSVLDPLYAKALVLERGGRKLCFLSLDVTFVSREHTDRIRAAASERCGLEPDAVMVHATQTHSAPAIGAFLLDHELDLPDELDWLRLGPADYSDVAAESAIEAVVQADAALRPASVGFGSAVRDGLAFNRRGVTRDGGMCMPWTFSSLEQPLGPTNIRYLEGPTDPEVGVLCVRDEAGHMMAMLLHFTCHPVNVFYYRGRGCQPRVSADWPGAWAAAMRQTFGPDCVPLVLNGCCGNINPWPPFEPDFTPDHRRMGAALAESAAKVIATLTFADDVVLGAKSTRVPVPLRALDPDALADAKQLLVEHPEPIVAEGNAGAVDRQWFNAAMLVSLDLERKRQPELPCEVQALRVGDCAVVGLPGEPFVEGQLAIKIGSPTYPTYVAHATNHFAGYIPTAEGMKRGGHEVNTSSWAKLTPDALDRLTGGATELLAEVFA